jgi:hypothetical protein
MPASSYAVSADVFGPTGYLRDPNPGAANSTIMGTLLGVASRLIDEACGQVFYDDGAYQQEINGSGGSKIDTNFPFFFSSGTIDAASPGATTLQYTPSTFAPRAPVANEAMVIDTGSNREVLTPSVVGAISGGKYPLTVPATANTHAAKAVATTIQITIAYFENQPTAQWIQQLDGDGWTSPSNFYVWPNRIRRVGSSTDQTATRPFYAVDLPMIPISSTTWLPTTMIGKATIGITAHWGWPVVPDLIKDITCKAAARLWRKRQAGESDAGNAMNMAVGAPALSGILDQNDMLILNQSGLKLTYI